MDFIEKIDCIMKSINVEKLNYFKRELLKIFDEKERQKEKRLSKSIDDYFNEINKSIYGAGWIIKGDVRTWKDGNGKYPSILT